MSYGKLVSAIKEFTNKNPNLGTFNGAYDMCFEASCEFQDLLFERGLITEEGREKDWDVVCVPDVNGHRINTNLFQYHWVFRYRDLLIDFTARQISKRLNFPEIWKGQYSSTKKTIEAFSI